VSSSRCLSCTRLAPLPWRWWRVRPENLPTRRAAGLSQVAAAWLRHDPIDLLLDDLAEAERLERPGRLAEPWHQRALEPYSSTEATRGTPAWSVEPPFLLLAIH
jgi:hypothetical protein